MNFQVSTGELDPGLGHAEGGHSKRTGTLWTASAHIITAVIGSGVLSLAWAIAQIGWAAGPAVMLLFSFVTYYTSALLADCYRSSDACTGKRNYTYMDAVNTNLSGIKVQLCGFLQYANIVGVAIGYTIAASISMLNIKKRLNCFHVEGHGHPCKISAPPYMIIFGVAEIFFSQIPDFDQTSWLSILAVVMSFAYSTIGLGLGIVQVVANKGVQGRLTGISVGAVTPIDKVWRSLQALGDIAFAYSFTHILVEIQDTLPSSQANTVMRRANILSSAINTFFSLLCGGVAYAALGDGAPDNLLAGFGYVDSWLIDVANAAALVHLAIAYQLCCRPIFSDLEQRAQERRWPLSAVVANVPLCGGRWRYKLSLFRLTWRTVFVAAMTAVPVLLPSSLLKDVVGFLSALGFWPLTVYFPVEMYLVQKKVAKGSTRWVCMQLLSYACLLVTVGAGIGYLAGIVSGVKAYDQQS